MTRARDLAAFVSNADGDIKFDTDTLFVDSSANRVGIGTDTPATKLSLVSNGAGGDIHVKNGSGQNALLELAGNDNTCGSTSALFGQVTDNTVNLFNRANANLVFGTNNAERMRIDSSGRAMVGTTTEGNAAADDLTLSGSGHVGMTIRSTDSTSSRIYFSDATSGTGEYTGYFVYDHSNNSLQVATSSAERIRVDSDGLKFNGDTASANALDDYEEGTYTHTITGSTSGSWTVRSGYTTLGYTKIGRLVTVTGQLETLGTKTASGNVQISLPFTAASGQGFSTGSAFPLRNNGTNLEGTNYANLSNNQSFFLLTNLDHSGTLTVLNDSHLDSSWEGKFHLTYMAA